MVRASGVDRSLLDACFAGRLELNQPAPNFLCTLNVLHVVNPDVIQSSLIASKAPQPVVRVELVTLARDAQELTHGLQPVAAKLEFVLRHRVAVRHHDVFVVREPDVVLETPRANEREVKPAINTIVPDESVEGHHILNALPHQVPIVDASLNLVRSQRATNDLATKLLDCIRETNTVCGVKVARLNVKESDAFFLLKVPLFVKALRVSEVLVTMLAAVSSHPDQFGLRCFPNIKLIQLVLSVKSRVLCED